ncbi:MAG: glycosyltransferase family 2 protein [bacterium]|nr:glycosyltransferase family 2 protein [bacterium]
MIYDFTNTSIVIPFYQAYNSIRFVITQCLALDPNIGIIIVDDGSEPPLILSSDNSRIQILRNETNSGKGVSLQKGIDFAFSNNKNAVICIDADGQHPVEKIKDILEFANSSDVDLILGNRINRLFNMPIDRVLSNLFSSVLLSVITFRHLPDVQCGFRFIALKRWKQLNCNTKRFEWESQVLLQAIWNRWRIAFIPIPTLYLHLDKSNIQRWSDTIRFLKMVFSECWKYYFRREYL